MSFSSFYYPKYSIFYFDPTLFQKYVLKTFGRLEFSIRNFFCNRRNPKHTKTAVHLVHYFEQDYWKSQNLHLRILYVLVLGDMLFSSIITL